MTVLDLVRRALLEDTPLDVSLPLVVGVSGGPFRTKIVDEFIRYAKGFPKVWFARRIEIANWCLKNGF